MKKKVMVFGYWMNNLGDDIFLKVLCNRYKSTDFVIITSKRYKDVYKKIPNLTIKYYDNIGIYIINKILEKLNFNSLDTRYAIKKTSLCIFLGGSIFTQYNDNWLKSVKEREYLIDNIKDCFVLGSNFGPYFDNGFLKAYKNIFKKTNDVCFRDNYSASLFPEVDSVRYSSDIAFNLKNNIDFEQNKKGDYFIVSVINLKLDNPTRKDINKYTNHYETFIAQMVDYIIEKGNKVYLMSFCEYEKDSEAINRIMKQTKNKENIYTYIHKHIDNSLNLISNSKGIIGTRLHSIILAWLYKIPVYPIIYNEKMKNVINEYKFTGGYCDIKNIETINKENVYYCLTHKNGIDHNVIENSKLQFEVLDKYLNCEDI